MEAQINKKGQLRWIGGAHAVEETLRSKPSSVQELWVEHEHNSPAVKTIIGLARQHQIKIQFIGRKDIDRAVAGGRHQGVAVKVFESESSDFFDYIERLTLDDKRKLVLVALDQIQDPHNLGAIARSAVNLGAKGLIIPERRSASVTATVVQSSAGAIQKIPIFHVVNLGQALERCRDQGFWIYGADGSGRPAWKVRLIAPMILVIGSEGYGMRPLVKSYCHELVAIPQAPGGVESLNASCAASVLLYEISRQLAGVSA